MYNGFVKLLEANTEELETDYFLFDGLTQFMKESVHQRRTKFMNLGLRSVPLFITDSLENGVCD